MIKMKIPKGFIFAIKDYKPLNKRLRMIDIINRWFRGYSGQEYAVRLRTIRNDKFLFVIPDNFNIVRKIISNGIQYKEKNGYKINLKIYPLTSFCDYCFFVADFLTKKEIISCSYYKELKNNNGMQPDRQMVYFLISVVDFLEYKGTR